MSVSGVRSNHSPNADCHKMPAWNANPEVEKKTTLLAPWSKRGTWSTSKCLFGSASTWHHPPTHRPTWVGPGARWLPLPSRLCHQWARDRHLRSCNPHPGLPIFVRATVTVNALSPVQPYPRPLTPLPSLYSTVPHSLLPALINCTRLISPPMIASPFTPIFLATAISSIPFARKIPPLS